jgi:hypothetical protein
MTSMATPREHDLAELRLRHRSSSPRSCVILKVGEGFLRSIPRQGHGVHAGTRYRQLERTGEGIRRFHQWQVLLLCPVYF